MTTTKRRLLIEIAELKARLADEKREHEAEEDYLRAEVAAVRKQWDDLLSAIGRVLESAKDRARWEE